MGINKNLHMHFLVAFALATSALAATLSPYYYEKSCPYALPTIKKVIEDAVNQERRMGASLLRLHFHDCFVNVRFLIYLFKKTTITSTLFGMLTSLFTLIAGL